MGGGVGVGGYGRQRTNSGPGGSTSITDPGIDTTPDENGLCGEVLGTPRHYGSGLSIPPYPLLLDSRISIFTLGDGSQLISWLL
jgi:hypothetical protein